MYMHSKFRMAEPQAVTEQVLKKLEAQLTCAICLDAFKDPKLLQCFHVYCKDCLQQLVVQDKQGQLSLRCPTCRQSTLLPPATDLSHLQPAFHIHHLLEIQNTLEKVKEPQKVLCGKCTKSQRPATSYCRDCGEFICGTCVDVHREWDAFAEHEVVSLEQLERRLEHLDALKKVTLYCSLHNGKELELYCETCGDLICHNCTVSKHCRPEHNYALVNDTFKQHEADIKASLEPVENLHGVVFNALKQLDQQSTEINDQQTATETEIQQLFQQVYEVLEVRKAKLISQLDQFTSQKLRSIEKKKDELVIIQAQLVSCLTFVRDSLRRGSQGEVMKMKKTVMKQIKKMTDNFKPEAMSLPCESASVKFTASSELIHNCQQFGDVYLSQVSPEKCHAIGEGLKVAVAGETATAVLHIVDRQDTPCSTPVESITCELVPDECSTCMYTSTPTISEQKKCCVKKLEASQYEISYEPTSRGRHQLHIKVEGVQIKKSPFSVTVKQPVQRLGTPIRVINGVNCPWGVTVNQRGEIIVAERHRHCISIFNLKGDRLISFGSQGSEQGQFSDPHGVAVDGGGNILVADTGNNCIQKFTSDGKFIEAIGWHGRNPLEFSNPLGLAFSPTSEKILVADSNNNRIQILNQDMTFSSKIGSRGSGNGQFMNPWDVACDSTGHVYVVDSGNYRIQVFNAEGQFLRHFGKKGSGKGEMENPVSIIVDSNNMVYVTEYRQVCSQHGNHRVSVFTCEGKFLTSFGTQGSGPGQFNEPRGIAVDKNGVIYISDSSNNRLQLF